MAILWCWRARLASGRLARRRSSYLLPAEGAPVTFDLRCYHGERSLTYAPFIEMPRSMFGKNGRDREWLFEVRAERLSEASRPLPELGSLRPGLPPLLALDSPGAQSRFFDAIIRDHARLNPWACSRGSAFRRSPLSRRCVDRPGDLVRASLSSTTLRWLEAMPGIMIGLLRS